MTRDELDVAMDALAGRTPALLADGSREDSLTSFENALRTIGEQVVNEDRIHFWTRSRAILQAHGLLPAEEDLPVD